MDIKIFLLLPMLSSTSPDTKLQYQKQHPQKISIDTSERIKILREQILNFIASLILKTLKCNHEQINQRKYLHLESSKVEKLYIIVPYLVHEGVFVSVDGDLAIWKHQAPQFLE